METSTFSRFCAIAYEKSGIMLGESKEALVEARVGKAAGGGALYDDHGRFAIGQRTINSVGEESEL